MTNSHNKNKKVFVGMSGGVDSSVSAYLLKKAGYDVTGVFIKVWQPEGIPCTWKEDRLDAMRVAAQLNINFITLDLEKEYKQEVIDYLISEYKAGRVPNPDVMCNRYVKFGGFLDFAVENGADFVATGHYIQNKQNKVTAMYELFMSSDSDKDQSYFLWTLPQEKLSKVLFPIGHMEKKEVRKIAQDAKLSTANKKDSQGLCFIGKLDMKDFLKGYIETHSGKVLNEKGEVVGSHDGALLYAIGERHGFVIDKKTDYDKPSYVVSKDVDANTITISDTAPQDIRGQYKVLLNDTNWISGEPSNGNVYEARIRYRGTLSECAVEVIEKEKARVTIKNGDMSLSAGQSLVLYLGPQMIGGGIISEIDYTDNK